MSAWPSWKNQAPMMWTVVVMPAAKRNQAATIRSMTSPAKPPARRKARSSKT